MIGILFWKMITRPPASLSCGLRVLKVMGSHVSWRIYDPVLCNDSQLLLIWLLSAAVVFSFPSSHFSRERFKLKIKKRKRGQAVTEKRV